MDEKNKDKFDVFNDSGKEKRGDTKKPKKKKISPRTVSAIYMGVALCMVMVLALGVISTTDKVKSGVEELEGADISLPDISLSVPQVQKPSDNSGVVKDEHVGSDVSGVTDEIVEPDDSSEDTKAPVISYIRPVSGEILKGYHMDSLVFSQTMLDYRTHGGVDIAAQLGTDVCAYTDGTVKSISEDPFMGTTVEILHEAGVVSVYKNLDPKLAQGIKTGAEVKTGDVIGKVGQSAIIEIADAPHLHFELWMNGEMIDAEREIKDL